MGLYERWCEATKKKDKRKYYWTYVEREGGRDEIRADFAATIRSHYDRLERIAEDVKRLGYKAAAQILSEALPQTAKGRSGDLGEILATELVEEEVGLSAQELASRSVRGMGIRRSRQADTDLLHSGELGRELR
ncbi:hypothetical protein SD446_18520 [Bordetella hinzii]|uniref:hypothetical protein n=1 Tax=Bordetella hinzii TaxID=103855 RepID=UPI002A1898BA|nr:hypothetical protein [Bordetella hinzii]WPL80325.1 hypothetical protein SD446_18520 [Bordetella hinzii]